MIFKKMFALLPRMTSTTIAARMNLLVIGGLIAIIIMGGFNYYSGKINSEALNKVYEINVQAVNHLQKIDNILKDVRYRMAAILIGNTTFDISHRHLETSKIELEREFNELKALPLETDTEKVLMEEMVEGWKEVAGKTKTLEEAYVNKDKDDLADISNIGWSNLHKNFIRPLSDLLPIKEKAMKNLYDKSNDTNQVLFLTSIGLSIISAIGAFLMLYWVKLSITRSLREATDISNKVAQGDLTTEINITNEDELGKLLQQLNKMQTSLRDIVSEVRTVSDDINKTSMQLSDGNNKLSTRTEEQASSLEETAASMEELTSTVGQNAENATKANRLAQKASQVAHDGEIAMHQVIKTIGEVNQSSSKIVDIVSVIDNIAFQTNILALNAAVEAARAGEQGRGFAVVASEVRSLAQKAAVAAKEIKTLIENSVSKIQQGNKMVDNAGKTMNEIIISISEVTKIMQDIASASVEQSNGIAQVNKTIAQLDHVTQENAALVGEAAAAAESMTERAKQLNLAVDSFKID